MKWSNRRKDARKMVGQAKDSNKTWIKGEKTSLRKMNKRTKN